GLVAGNSLFVGGHFALGFALGAPALELIRGLGGAAAAAVALVALGAFGAIGWGWIRRRRTTAAPASNANAGDWAEAAWSACLGIGLLAPVAIDTPPMTGSA